MRKHLFIFLFFISATVLFSQTNQLENLQKQQQVLQEEIRNTNKLYLDVKKQATTILDRLNLINKQIESRRELINVQKREIEALNKEESKLENEIVRLDKELKEKQGNYANAIQGMLNQKNNQNKLLFILSGSSFGESLRRMQYLREYSKWQKSQADEIKKQNIEITLKKTALAETKVDKVRALSSLEEDQKKLQSEEQTRQSEVKAARGQEDQLRKELLEKQRQANQLNSQIEKLIAEEVARQEREAEERRLAEEAKRASEKSAEDKKEVEEIHREEEIARVDPGPRIESGKAVAPSESFALSKVFAENRGKLPLPVTGTASIIGAFGTKQHSEWNITTNSNGIDIQAENGANIRSVFEGEVSKVFSFPGSNTCVIVRHGDYYTFYGNIYDLHVKLGDKVQTGQSLGRIFTDPDTGISTMHFQLWQRTNKLNPSPWLSR